MRAMKYALAIIAALLPLQAHGQDFDPFFQSCPEGVAKIDGPTQNDWDMYTAGLIGLPLRDGVSQRNRDLYEAGRKRLKLGFIKPRCPTDTERANYGAIAAAECFLSPARLGNEARAALDHARRNLKMQPYANGLCIKAGVVPFSLRVIGGETH